LQLINDNYDKYTEKHKKTFLYPYGSNQYLWSS
jgi:hypothetical protein